MTRVPHDARTLVALVGSWSVVASRGEPERERMLERVRDPWDRHPDLRAARDPTPVYRTEAFRVRLA